MQRARLSSILAHVLASTTLLACGGKTSEVSDPAATEPASTSSSTSSSGGTQTTPPIPPPNPPPPTPKDAGPDVGVKDAGCSIAPELVRESSGCSDVWYHACGVPAGVDFSDGLDQTECDKLCGKSPTGFQYWGCSAYLPADLPGPSFNCYTCVEGRRPEGFVELPLESTVGGWLAHAADLERVSIDAFSILARELAYHAAPHALIAGACAAEADEVRHASALGALARREGAVLSDAPIARGPVRDLLAIALENAIEGCVRETYGALVAGYQAQHAMRLDVRRAMKRIYADETTHAELAWSVHAWIMTKLGHEDRVRVEAAMADTFAELTRSANAPMPRAWVEELGLPRPSQARRLVSSLVQSLDSLAA